MPACPHFPLASCGTEFLLLGTLTWTTVTLWASGDGPWGTRDSTSRVQIKDFDPTAQHRLRLQALDTQTLDCVAPNKLRCTWGSAEASKTHRGCLENSAGCGIRRPLSTSWGTSTHRKQRKWDCS